MGHGLRISSQLLDRAIWSRSHVADDMNPSHFDVTVNLRHCEKDAVFKPSPNLPKSSGLLCSVGD